MRKRLVMFALAGLMLFTSTPTAMASKYDDNVKKIESQKNALQKQIDALDSDLVGVLADMNIVKKEISDTKKELAESKEKLAAAEKKEEKQYSDMKKRIKYMYENDETSYLSAILESKSISDVINKVKYFSEMYSSDRKLLKEYKETKNEVAELVEKVQDKKDTLTETQESYEKQKAKLKSTLSEKKKSMKDYSVKLKKAKELAAEYARKVAEQQAEARRQAAAAAARRRAAAAATSSQDRSDNSSDDSNNSGSSSNSSSPSIGTTNASGSGSAVVSYGAQFVGNKYVWGGTSLTDGCDCSGFVMQVYAHFGVSLPRTSQAMRSVGREVSASDIQPGDIVCYSGHVGIYAGNGQLLNASNSAPYPRGGIKYQSWTYRSYITIRRIF